MAKVGTDAAQMQDAASSTQPLMPSAARPPLCISHRSPLVSLVRDDTPPQGSQPSQENGDCSASFPQPALDPRAIAFSSLFVSSPCAHVPCCSLVARPWRGRASRCLSLSSRGIRARCSCLLRAEAHSTSRFAWSRRALSTRGLHADGPSNRFEGRVAVEINSVWASFHTHRVPAPRERASIYIFKVPSAQGCTEYGNTYHKSSIWGASRTQALRIAPHHTPLLPVCPWSQVRRLCRLADGVPAEHGHGSFQILNIQQDRSTIRSNCFSPIRTLNTE